MFFLPIEEIGGFMPKEDKAKYDMEYAKAKLKRIPLDVPKEKYEEIREAATEAGKKVNGYIKKAIDKTMYQKILYLDTSIMLNSELQKELETLLIENSDFIESYSRESISTGENRLILQFIKNDPINHSITEQYCKVLDKYSVRYSEHNNVPFDSMERDNQNK